ncbi:MAG: hypothetical protein JGK24_21605 [Microcoleus sp. PH2017_29_MFU_D_A]|uniref:hypothetical protein n=1 Tax=unclassified Microcoleus TaxID=2642155 RepID=UPI001E0E05A1|nr:MULTISPECIES: hypothetical protein [unclassified Microcoleus]MCC3418557.1 hypothetical protein [Microcoleus sp. PH2017_07_MST_O_A]MCC3443432.1 hypothetical protein [Microcoleus sp. PH2017_03_ELD_O_A]MCC3509713.1 hypothetical protein [Microcoleus sp. PH2017_17_BER_D_A]MCC3415578.1 hypothetical protein [Microcoleus sp. PH2017_02_FOX_O_A]MCC3438254.1 hypothetical protein [Microcoleus sp. PH2017_05_CCC_O_A]
MQVLFSILKERGAPAKLSGRFESSRLQVRLRHETQAGGHLSGRSSPIDLKLEHSLPYFAKQVLFAHQTGWRSLKNFSLTPSQNGYRLPT